ncbi:BTB/POZ protein [Rhizophagus irregularis DAOM 181602=DAOM 197198]|nr:BTB/POZ protein [Rhizophagus irregularis DAOM 181602=DAOM 197198]
MSFENNSFLKLQNFCTEIISKEPEKIFNSIDFVSISEKCLISLIKHNNIQMDDIKVWDHVLKWGIAQSSELSSDLSSYTKDDFNTLKDILKQCIPFIKFYDLTSKEFLDKVYPYKKIIPKELRENLIEYYLNHDHSPIRQKIIKEIVKDSNEILGGYNPIENMQNYILSRAKLGMYSIYSDFDCGPTFGDSLVLHGNDFYNKSYCKTHAGYEKIIRETEDIFSVEEYEIFQITKE